MYLLQIIIKLLLFLPQIQFQYLFSTDQGKLFLKFVAVSTIDSVSIFAFYRLGQTVFKKKLLLFLPQIQFQYLFSIDQGKLFLKFYCNLMLVQLHLLLFIKRAIRLLLCCILILVCLNVWEWLNLLAYFCHDGRTWLPQMMLAQKQRWSVSQ